MSIKITPQEFQIAEDSPNVRTSVSWEAIDADPKLLLERVRSARMKAGDTIKVVCMNHAHSEVLAAAIFMVVGAKTEVKTVWTDDVNSRTFQETTYEVARWGDWWTLGVVVDRGADVDTGIPVRRGPGRPPKVAAA